MTTYDPSTITITPSRAIARLAAMVLAIFVVLVGSGCTSGTATGEPAAATAAATGSDDSLAPAFELPSLGGDQVALADSSGSIRLIDFWATWCAPCREEIPMLNGLHERFGDRGLTIIAITDEDAELVRAFVEENGVQYTNLIDRAGEVTGAYLVPGLPTAILVDADGRVVDRFFGPKPEAVLEKKIVALLGEPAA